MMNDQELAEIVTDFYVDAGIEGNFAFFVPSQFKQPIRPGLPGCNWKILRMN